MKERKRICKEEFIYLKRSVTKNINFRIIRDLSVYIYFTKSIVKELSYFQYGTSCFGSGVIQSKVYF
jgi:hypothetical protein